MLIRDFLFIFYFLSCVSGWENPSLSLSPHLTSLKRASSSFTPLSGNGSSPSTSSMLLNNLLSTHTRVYPVVTRKSTRRRHLLSFLSDFLETTEESLESFFPSDQESSLEDSQSLAQAFSSTSPSMPLPKPSKSRFNIQTSSFSSFKNALSSTLEVVPAIELPSHSSLDAFVQSGVLSRDYNASWRHQRMNPGRLACQLSLVRALTSFLDSSMELALIFEDDVTVSPGLDMEKARRLTVQLLLQPRNKWDVIYLGYCHSCESFGSMSSKGWISNHVLALCAHAIVFSRRAARAFLKRWRPLHTPGDNKLTKVICDTGLKVIRPILPIFDQDRSLGKSQTGTKNKPLLPYVSEAVCKRREDSCASIPATRQKQFARTPSRSKGLIDRNRRSFRGSY